MSIEDFREKINSNARFRAFLLGGIIILSSTASFGLGRLSGSAGDQTPIIIERGVGNTADFQVETSQNSEVKPETASVQKAQSAAIGNIGAPTQNPQTGAFFASKNGTRYYPLGCKAGNRIADKNKIFFATAAQAELLGLTKASGCK